MNSKKLVLNLFLQLAVASSIGSSAFAKALVDPAIRRAGQGLVGRPVRVVVLMDAKKGVVMPRRYDHAAVVTYLRQSASEGMKDVVAYLKTAGIAPTDVKLIKLFASSGSFNADVTPAGLAALENAPGVSRIYYGLHAVTVDPYRRTPTTQAPRRGLRDAEMPYDYKEVGLDKLIAERPMINGTGVVLGHVDTGVDGKHPALAGKILMFYNGATKSRGEPVDSDQHGTHTAGTMVGGDWNLNRIGMAPGAKLVSAGPLSSFEDMVQEMEIMLDPDGNPQTKDMPRAVSNSWNCRGAPDMEVFYRGISAWEAAGILPVFSAGNSGPAPRTITPPHEHPLAFAVAATGKNGKVTSFSSRGPGMFKGQETQKPDISAPGEAIRSSLPGGGYGDMSGTSMSAPHVAGATALLFQVNPALNPTQIRAILIKTAMPMGMNDEPGPAGVWNPSYGMGKLNVYDAVKLASGAANLAGGRSPFMNGFSQGMLPLSMPEDWDATSINGLRPASTDDLLWQ